MNGERKPETGALDRIARGIVRAKWIMLALFAAATVFCAVSMGKVRTNPELTAFLPPESETRRGLAVMNAEFGAFTSAEMMVTGVSEEEALTLADGLRAVDHVTSVSFDTTPSHYDGGRALYTLLFRGGATDPGVKEAMKEVVALASPHETAFTTAASGDFTEKLAGEMTGVVLIAFAVIAVGLLFTSRSFFEIPVMAAVFAVAAVLNMGTNAFLGEISVITHMVAMILQLALAIDYAIIFIHRYQDEAALEASPDEAISRALARSIREIVSSSLTTVSGLVALTFMQFRLGRDLGVVLAKGILFSMLTVFCLMPALISISRVPLKKTLHRSLVPNVEGWGRFLVKSRGAFAVLFLLILVPAIVFSGKVNYAFSDPSVTEIVSSERREAMHEIANAFSSDSTVAVLVPRGDPEAERSAAEAIAALPHTENVVALSLIRIGEIALSDEITAAEAARLTGVSEEDAKTVFGLYSLSEGKIYEKVSVGRLALFLADLAETNALPALPQEAASRLTELLARKGELKTALDQLQGENWDRFVVSVSLPAESDEALAWLADARAELDSRYGEGETYLLGDITATRDLKASYTADSVLISVMTVVFVFLILLAAFRSPVAALILVFVIQGSIWINFASAYLVGARPSFVTQMIVSAIQMGATIDYAIVFLSHYREARKDLAPKEAAARAVHRAFPTVITSGLILTAAGMIIAYRVSDVYVGHIGLAVGRGALISVVLVMTVLPQLILLLDRWIEKTTFRRKKKE